MAPREKDYSGPDPHLFTWVIGALLVLAIFLIVFSTIGRVPTATERRPVLRAPDPALAVAALRRPAAVPIRI